MERSGGKIRAHVAHDKPIAVGINGSRWEEIDYPRDLPRAEALVSSWDQPSVEVEPAAVVSSTG